jgi:DNA-directed RNA polymerase I, II, and III subunit RPABC2
MSDDEYDEEIEDEELEDEIEDEIEQEEDNNDLVIIPKNEENRDEIEEDELEEEDQIEDINIINEFVYDDIIHIVDKHIKPQNRTTSNIMTKYERAKLIGIRAEHLNRGAPANIIVPKNITNTIEIARLELEQKKIPLGIRRYNSNNEYEEWTMSDLILK